MLSLVGTTLNLENDIAVYGSINTSCKAWNTSELLVGFRTILPGMSPTLDNCKFPWKGGCLRGNCYGWAMSRQVLSRMGVVQRELPIRK